MNTEHFTARIARQSELADDLVQLCNQFQKQPKDNRTKVFISIQSRRIDDLFTKFDKNHDLISDNILAADRKTNTYLKSKLFESTSEIYWNMQLKIEEWKEEIVRQQLVPENNHSRDISTTYIQLPKIQIKEFSGDYRQWISFKNIFSILIHEKESLPKIQKFYYLKSHVVGEANQLINHYTITDDNYDAAWQTLCNRYDNNRILINSEIKTLLDQAPMTTESATEIKNLLDTTQQCLNALKNLKIDIATWNPLLMFILQQKLNATTCYYWENSLQNPKEVPAIQQFFTFLELRFNALQNIPSKINGTQTFPDHQQTQQEKTMRNSYNLNKFSSPHNKYTNTNNANSTSNGNSTTSNIKRQSFLNVLPSSRTNCEICDGNHKLFQCDQFLRATVEQRRNLTTQHHHCINCLHFHDEKSCRSSNMCRICGIRHHTLLHTMDNNDDQQDSNNDGNARKIQTKSYFTQYGIHSKNNFTTTARNQQNFKYYALSRQKLQ